MSLEIKENKNNKIQHKRVRTPAVYQIEAAECGAACLSMIMGYYGGGAPMEEIRYHCGVSRDGCSAADIVRAARHFGLEPHAYRREPEALAETGVPCILHWNFSHFVVLEGVGKNCAYINDPASGRRKISWQELDEAFTGVVLCFTPTENFQRRETKRGLWELVEKRLGEEKGAVAYLFLTGLLLVVPVMALAVLTERFVDTVLLQGRSFDAAALITAILLTHIFRIAFTWLRGTVLTTLRLKLSMRSNFVLLQKMLRLPSTFFEQRYAGELAQRMENNSEVNGFLAGNFSEAVLNVFQAVFYLILMLSYSTRLTLVGCLGVALSLLVSGLLLRPLASLNARKMQDSNRLTGMLCAGISASATIKAGGVENEYASDILGYYAGQSDSEQRLGRAQQIVTAIPASVSNVFQVMVMMIGGGLVITGQCTTGALTAFCQLLSAFVEPVNMLIGLSQRVQGMTAALSRVEDIDSARQERRYEAEADNDIKLPVRFNGGLEARNLVFGYNPGLGPVVRGFTVKACPGSRIALVGTSGCGKSTVGKLLAGLASPWQGEILYDGIPLDKIPPQLLCESLSVIGQNATLFSGSIRENLSFWRTDYSENEMFRAVMDAQAYDMINALPGAYEYKLDEGGRNLSGGQRQKLEIARALMTDPSVIIMDEATSALDAVTEKRIMDNLRRRGCTLFIIAHRLSTVRDCDLIMVMDKGAVVEYGSHEQLLAHGGVYARLIAG